MALAAVVYLIFMPALPGIVHFDDRANLSGLSSISNIDSALEWMQSGIAGPLGRPFSLATFALQYYNWPDSRAFLVWNIAIHCINALLGFWLFFLIGKRLGWKFSRSINVAWLAALLWASMPFLNSSVLFLVQRMSLLSTTWILIGLISYLKIRGDAQAPWHRQWRALAAMGFAGTLSMLSKESGAMIVIYTLILEISILRLATIKQTSQALWALIFACAILLAMLSRHAEWTYCTEITRGFDVWQRLGSQGIMLLIYIKGLFLPTLTELNPFRLHSDGVFREIQWLGVTIWLGLMAAPVFLWRSGQRTAALVAAWFFFGHVMESGWVALEPYFAHRNYTPSIIPAFALVGWTFNQGINARIKRGGLLLYIALAMMLTWMNTSLWGDRELAGEIWAKEQPKTTRSALNLAYVLEERYGLAQAQAYLDHVIFNDKDSVGLRLQRLLSACQINPESDHSQLVRDVLTSINALPYEGWSTDLLDHLAAVTNRQSCVGVTNESLAQIASTFLQHPSYACSPPIRHNMLMMIGYAAYREGDFESSLHFWLKALGQAISFSTAGFVLDVAVEQENHDAILELLKLIEFSDKPKSVTKQEWTDLIMRTKHAELSLRP